MSLTWWSKKEALPGGPDRRGRRWRNQIAVAAGANEEVTARDVAVAVERAQGWPSCVLISTEISAAAVAAGVEAAAMQGWLCVLNPAPVTADTCDLLRFAPIITPNRGELQDLYRLLGGTGDASVEAMATAVASRSRAPVVVTLGAEGVLLCSAAGVSNRIPAGSARLLIDTTRRRRHLQRSIRRKPGRGMRFHHGGASRRCRRRVVRGVGGGAHEHAGRVRYRCRAVQHRSWRVMRACRRGVFGHNRKVSKS